MKRKIAKSSSFSFAFVRVFCLLVVDFVLGRGGVVFRLFEEEQEEQQEDHALLRSVRRGGATTDDVREEVGDGVTVIHRVSSSVVLYVTTDAFSLKSEFGRRRKMNFCEENFQKKKAKDVVLSRVSFTQNRDEKEEEEEDGEEVAIARLKKE